MPGLSDGQWRAGLAPAHLYQVKLVVELPQEERRPGPQEEMVTERKSRPQPERQLLRDCHHTYLG